MDSKKILQQVRRRPRVHGYIARQTETRISPIQGLGLFAKGSIKKGVVVAAWGGCVTTTTGIRKLPESIGFHYALQLYPGIYVAECNCGSAACVGTVYHD